MSYWTEKERKELAELNYEDHKKVKVRKNQHCYNSGDTIWKGKEAFAVKVYPSSYVGRGLKIDSPKMFYKCDLCGECTH
jgi:hypothetical protein